MYRWTRCQRWLQVPKVVLVCTGTDLLQVTLSADETRRCLHVNGLGSLKFAIRSLQRIIAYLVDGSTYYNTLIHSFHSLYGSTVSYVASLCWLVVCGYRIGSYNTLSKLWECISWPGCQILMLYMVAWVTVKSHHRLKALTPWQSPACAKWVFKP